MGMVVFFYTLVSSKPTPREGYTTVFDNTTVEERYRVLAMFLCVALVTGYISMLLTCLLLPSPAGEQYFLVEDYEVFGLAS